MAASSALYFGDYGRQQDGWCRRSGSPPLSPPLAGSRPRVEVEDGVGVHTMARVSLIENNVQYRVASTVDQLQALFEFTMTGMQGRI